VTMLVKCGKDVWINTNYVQTMRWDHAYGRSILKIKMSDGSTHSFDDSSGQDCYAIEKQIAEGSKDV